MNTVSDMLNMALPLAEMTIIKRDFDIFKKLALSLSPDVQTQLVSYSALFCYEIIEYLNKNGQQVDIEQTSRYSIKEIRQKAKFFDLSVNKLMQSIENIDELQNDYFINLMKYPQLGYWNMHTNLGIFFDNDKNIVGNTHYAYYVFQDEKMICKTKDVMSGHELSGEEIRAFAYDMGRIIGSISSGFSELSDFMVADVSTESINLNNQDFNTNRCGIIGNDEYKIVRLFLLHVLSSLGFVLYVLKKVIIRDTGLLLRFEYITYHYAIKRLEGILNYCRSSKSQIDDNNLIEALNKIDYNNANHLRDTNFRNCMMHFGLKGKNDSPLIKEEKFNLALPFCGLVESVFDMTYDEYKEKVESELTNLYDIIRKYLQFELLLADKE